MSPYLAEVCDSPCTNTSLIQSREHGDNYVQVSHFVKHYHLEYFNSKSCSDLVFSFSILWCKNFDVCTHPTRC